MAEAAAVLAEAERARVKTTPRPGGAGRGVAGLGAAGPGRAWRGEARQGTARLGKARRGMARQGKARFLRLESTPLRGLAASKETTNEKHR